MIVGSITFVCIRISISYMFWNSKKPNDKAYMFRTFFPYYIITLFGLGVLVLAKLNFELYAIYIFGVIYISALLIWNYKLKHCKRKYTTTQNNDESQNPNLP